MKKIFYGIFTGLSAKIRAGLPSYKTGVNSKGDITKYFDKYAEKFIISRLKKKVKFRASIISEEMKKPFVINPGAPGPMYYIIIDPVDGSDNYLAGTPFVAVAIAVFGPDLEPVYSFAGNYYTGDCMYADREKLFYNHKKIKAPFKKPPKKLLLLVVSKTREKKPGVLSALANDFDIVRSFGATAGEMLYVLNGEAKAFVDLRGGLTLENFAPFILAARHAGLMMTDDTGRDFRLKSLSMTAGYRLIFSDRQSLKKIQKRLGPS